MKFKPMLSAAITDTRSLNFPLLGSPKLDGVRVCVQDGKLVSRNLKPIPNKYCHHLFSKSEYEGLDGELIVGGPTDKGCLETTKSGVMTREGCPAASFYAFDFFDAHGVTGYMDRLKYLQATYKRTSGVKVLPQAIVRNHTELIKLQEQFLTDGYEGLMLRTLDGKYKQGRSTLKEGWLMKLKVFDYDDAVIVDTVEKLHNANPLGTDALGHAKRSDHKAGKVPAGTLGAFQVVGLSGPFKGKSFHVGTGNLTAVRAQSLWAKRGRLPGTKLCYKYFLYGSVDAPRFPGFFSWDLSHTDNT